MKRNPGIRLPFSNLVPEVLGYAELQREMHDALLAQYPEWIEADGKSPTCDSYEARFAELLVSHQTKCGQACMPAILSKETQCFPKTVTCR